MGRVPRRPAGFSAHCSMSVAEVNRSRGSTARARRATSRNGKGSCSVASGPGTRRLPVNTSTMTAPDREEIRLHGRRLSRPALRSQIARRTQHDARHRQVVGHTVRCAPDIEALCDAEVGDLRVPVVLEEDVARLDVAVHDAELVGGGQGRQRLHHDGHNPLPGERTSHDLVSQRGPRQPLHDQVGGGVILPVVQDGDDVGMDEPSRRSSPPAGTVCTCSEAPASGA